MQDMNSAEILKERARMFLLGIKDQVRAMSAAAINQGHIVRPDMCQGCGKTCKVHGHHPDYLKPFKLIWLCVKCHMKEHPNLRIGHAEAEAIRRDRLAGVRMVDIAQKYQISTQTIYHIMKNRHATNRIYDPRIG